MYQKLNTPNGFDFLIEGLERKWSRRGITTDLHIVDPVAFSVLDFPPPPPPKLSTESVTEKIQQDNSTEPRIYVTMKGGAVR